MTESRKISDLSTVKLMSCQEYMDQHYFDVAIHKFCRQLHSARLVIPKPKKIWKKIISKNVTCITITFRRFLPEKPVAWGAPAGAKCG